MVKHKEFARHLEYGENPLLFTAVKLVLTWHKTVSQLVFNLLTDADSDYTNVDDQAKPFSVTFVAKPSSHFQYLIVL